MLGAVLKGSPPGRVLVQAQDWDTALPPGLVTVAPNDLLPGVEAPPVSVPLVLIPRWGRPRNLGLSTHHEAVLSAPAWADPLVVLLPAGDLDSSGAAEFRRRVVEDWHPELVALLPGDELGAHTRFVACLLVLRPAAGRGSQPIRFLDAVAALRDPKAEPLGEATAHLLRKQGGTTAHGYVLREMPADGRLGFRSNDPALAARRIALADYGGSVTFGSLFEVLPRGRFRDIHRRGTGPTGDVRARAVEGRDVQFGRIAEGVPDADNDRSVVARPEELLRPGDVLFREFLSTPSSGRGLAWAKVCEQDLPAVQGRSVVAARPRPGTLDQVRSFVLQYLSSPGAADLADAGGVGGPPLLSPSRLNAMSVPVPDEPMLFALQGLTRARDSAKAWEAEASDLLSSLFEGPEPASNRARVLTAGRQLRQRVAVAEMIGQLGHRVQSRYPLPVAARWRVLQALRSAGASAAAYQATLETAEVLLGYLACVGLAVATDSGTSLASLQQIRQKLAKGKGPDLGDWVATLRELNGKKGRPVSERLGSLDLCAYLGSEGVGVAVKALADRRNDESHIRRVSATDLPSECDAAVRELEVLLTQAAFVEDLPLLLAGPVRWNARKHEGVLSARTLAGDHPVVDTDERLVKTPSIEFDSLYVQDAVGELHLLRPFLVARLCSKCHTLSTFHVDKVLRGVVKLKSFEHGHVIDDASMVSSLADVGLLES